MIEVNWDLQPEGTIELRFKAYEGGHLRVRPFRGNGQFFSDECNEWVDANGCWQTIATRPTQIKTVADAVEQKKIDISEMSEGMKVKCVRADSGCYKVGSQYVVGRDEGGYFGPLNEKGLASFNHQAYSFELVEDGEQDGEKWTHVTKDGINCVVLFTKGNESWIKTTWNSELVPTEELKPIKPTMTKVEHDAIVAFAESSGEQLVTMKAEEYLAKHDII